MNGSKPDTELYDLLGVSPTASKGEIKKAYHKQALQHHPDKVSEEQRPEAEAKFKAASQAYEILSDHEKRHLYDTHGMAAFDGSGGPGGMNGMDMNDILSQMFGMGGGMPGMGGAGGSRKPRRSPDENEKYEVSLEDLYKGKTVKFNATKNVICSHCDGSGGKKDAKPKECATCQGQGYRMVVRQVGPGMLTQQTVECGNCEGTGKVFNPKDKCKKCKGKRTMEEKKQLELYIPRGAKEGERIVLEGEADQVPGAVDHGDIIFHLVELPHDVFHRAGPDLSAKLEITLAEALVGFDRVVIKHLDGRGIHLTHPQNGNEILRPNQTIKVAGEGMPYKRSDAKGDLYLIVDIRFPDDGFFNDPTKVEQLRKLLPGPSAPIQTKEVDEATWEDADIEEFGRGDPRGGGAWEDDDDDDQAEGPQCATQ